MSRTNIDAQLRARVDAFVNEMSELIRQAALEQVSDALSGAQPRRGAARAARTVKAPSGKRIRRSAEDLDKLGERIVAFIDKNPGARMEDISKGLRRQTKELRRPVQILMAEKRVRTKGQKRATQYFVK